MILEHFFKNKKVWVIVLVIFLLSGAIYFIGFRSLDKPNEVACTLEAELCPDGSYVGRVGPNCEFSACPEINTDDLLGLYIDHLLGVTYRYPKQLTTKYISTVDWPPKFVMTDGPFVCNESGNEIMVNGKTVKEIIDGRVYCITKESEGAAGSIYTNYTYKTLKDDKVVIFTFNLRAVQCANYDDPKKTECNIERESFDVDSIVNEIVNSVVFN